MYTMRSNIKSEDRELLETLTKIYLYWCFEDGIGNKKHYTRNPEIFEESFICKVLDKRMEAFGIDVKIPDYLILIIELCTDSNPGKSLMILSEILENIPNLKKGHSITSLDFYNVYGNRFPVTRLYPEIDSRLEERWDSQKKTPTPLGTDNQCDYPEYWTKFFE